jgi:outer membrane murein-binding lipoprotein Lpp
VQEELGHLAHAHAGKSQELLDEMKHLQETVLKTAQVGASPGAPHAPVEEAGGGGALTPLTSKVEHTSRLLDEQTKVLQSLSEKITALTADEKQAASDAASAKQTLLGHVETVEKVLSAHTSTLNAHVTKLEEGMTTLTRQGHQTSEHVSAETKVIKTLVEKTSSGGGGSMVFPLAVCAQALVVAALLFYASAGGGKSRRSHLP